MSIWLSLLLSFILAFPAWIKKSFTICGLALAFAISTMFCYCGCLSVYLSLVALFSITLLTDQIKKSEKERIEKDKHKKGDHRDFFQVFNNLFLATICILIYKVNNKEIFYILFLTSLAVSAADTSASGIGILSKKAYRLLPWHKDERGLSGNVSNLGFIASFVAALLIGITYFLHGMEIMVVFKVACYGFVGAFLDSVLGCFQVKYKCSKCHHLTEKHIHCGKKTKYMYGIKFLNNDLVNFLSNFITLIIAYIIG